ncbi:hypothetical protein DMN91_012528 [Ooceraea biroi]|uniref:PAP-associated domain-containing protein n=1 Tax=Ooceraea biroi TaxID=2015173 RepID=A0A3L8D5M3_OOCBI|nr:hypothetical protein DMN91_012528 [Ooceraea biroi]
MEEIQRDDNISSDAPVKQHLISSRKRDAQNGPARNKTKQNGAFTEGKTTRKKKHLPLTLFQASTVPVTDNGVNNNVSVLTATSDMVPTPNGNVKKLKNGNNVCKDTSQILKENNSQVVECGIKVRKRRKKTKNGLNSSAKENVRANVTTNNAGDKASKQITSNGDCNDASAKEATVQTSTIAKHEATDDKRNKDTSTHQKYTYSRINYEFHEANHAIIDTFAIALDFFLRNDNKKCYCLVCDTTLRMQSDDVRRHLGRHIRSKRHIQLLSMMIEDEKRSVSNGESFSKLVLAREYMTSNDDFVKCLLCENKDLCSTVKKNEQSLREHIASNAHRDAKGSWEVPIKNMLQQMHIQFQSRYNAKKYCCEFCNYQTPSELYFVKHLHVPYHVTRLMDIPDHTNKFKFYFCNACLIMWFGSADTSDQHFELMEHKNRMMYGPDINDLPDQVVQFLTMSGLNAEVLLERSNRVKCHDEMRKYVLYSFETDLRKYIPNIRAYPFGSRISDLGFPESDIDIFLDCSWEVGVSYDFRVNGLNHTFEELLLGFFLFYGDFKYKKQVICPLLGRPVQKDTFVKLSDLPQEMAPYVAYMHTGTQEELPQAFFVSPLCVQDPFDLSHNLTKALNNKELKIFWNNCTASAQILKTTLPNLRSPLMPYSD